MVVQPAALSGHPGQQPHLVAGAGAQPVVPAAWSRRTRTRCSHWERSAARERARPTNSATVAGCSRGAWRRCGTSRMSPAIWRSLSLFMECGGSSAEESVGGGVSRTVRPGHGRERMPWCGPRGTAAESRWDSGAAGAREAQQLEQRQQLQRARAAPRDPAERVEVSAKFASMPTRTAVHTFAVNSTPGMWDAVHLIRFISRGERFVRGAVRDTWRTTGRSTSARSRDRGCDPVRFDATCRNEIELLGVLSRKACAEDRPSGAPACHQAACQGLCRFEHFPHGLGSAE